MGGLENMCFVDCCVNGAAKTHKRKFDSGYQEAVEKRWHVLLPLCPRTGRQYAGTACVVVSTSVVQIVTTSTAVSIRT